MADRPADWSPLSATDPVPGREWDLNALASHFAAVSSTVTDYGAQLVRLEKDSSQQRGKSIDALRADAEELAESLQQAVIRYDATRAALRAVVPVLTEQQAITLRALADARDAQVDLNAANARSSALSEQPAPTSATAADVFALQLSASSAAAHEAQERLDAARRRMESARETWEAAAVTAAKQIEDAIDGDDLRDRWYDNQTFRDVVGAVGQALWDTGPGAVVDLASLLAWLTPFAEDDEWAERLARWVDGGHDWLEHGWGTDTSSDAFKGVWAAVTVIVALIPVLGEARAVGAGARVAPKGAAVLDEARTAADLRSLARDVLWQMFPWYVAPLDDDDRTATGYLQGPAYLQGALGDDFAPGIVGSFELDATGRKEAAIAEVLVAEGGRVDPRYQPNWAKGVPNPDAMVRDDGEDAGTPTEFKTISQDATNLEGAARNNMRTINDQLAAWGGGDAVIDARGVGLTAEQAHQAVTSILGKAISSGKTWKMADEYMFLLGDGTTLTVRVDDLAMSEEVR